MESTDGGGNSALDYAKQNYKIACAQFLLKKMI